MGGLSGDENMEQQKQNVTNWLEEEQKVIQSESVLQFEKLPSLKLEENKVTEITIDFSKPFDKWQDPQTGANKKILPCVKTSDNLKYVFWLNVKNPLYAALIKKAALGQTKFKVLRTGQKNGTRYTLVED